MVLVLKRRYIGGAIPLWLARVKRPKNAVPANENRPERSKYLKNSPAPPGGDVLGTNIPRMAVPGCER